MYEIETTSVINEKVRFFGRATTTNGNNGVFFNWSGSGFIIKFIGTSAKAYFLSGTESDGTPEEKDRAYIGVFIDDNPNATAHFSLDCKESWYTLTEGLPFGEHTVRVVKETEVGYGRAAVLKISSDGEFLSAPKAKGKKLEFIGDSITCGYGNICSNASSEFLTREECFSNTYAALTAKMLDTELSCVAASGNGFYHDYGCQTFNLIPTLYLYADKMLDEHKGNAAKTWDFNSDKCDLVVIKLGQNDGQFCSGADLKETDRTEEVLQKRKVDFIPVAKRFLLKITECRPNTPIILIYESDMYLKDEIIKAADGVPNINLMEIAPKRSYEGIGANGHWSVYTHSRVAAELAERIKEILCLQ